MFNCKVIKTKIFLSYFCGFSMLCLIYYNFEKITNIHTTKPLIQTHTHTPLILLWTKTTYWKTYQLNKLDCEFKCEFTYDRNFISVSDGLMFYWREIKSNDLPSFRFEDQYWIVVHNEAPSYTPRLPEIFEGEINWPVSYRRDSSISTVYGKVVEREVALPYKLRTKFISKTRNVAWFVSHCPTKSKREFFVKQLSTFIDVDIYGSCGNLTCGAPTYKKKNDIMACYQMVESKYKFYFSAENALCNNYITEKLFFILDFEIIPVVYGGDNYSAILPPNSYIDARNFTKPMELADFLHKVGSNEQLYYSYFKWKSHYKVMSTASWMDEKLPKQMCEICKGLYSPTAVKDYRGTDINEWWFKEQCEENTKMKFIDSISTFLK